MGNTELLFNEIKKIKDTADVLLHEIINIVKEYGGAIHFDNDGDSVYGMACDSHWYLRECVIRSLRVKTLPTGAEELWGYFEPMNEWLSHSYREIDELWEKMEDTREDCLEWNEICHNGDIEFYSAILNIASALPYYEKVDE